MTMNCKNYDNYHDTICYFLHLFIPFYVSKLHSAPCSQTHSTNKTVLPHTNKIRMSLTCTSNDRFLLNLWKRKMRPNNYGQFWIRWYHWKTFGGLNPWCYSPIAESTSVPNCRESLKSSKPVTVIMHINCVHLRWTLSCTKYDDSSWWYLPCNSVILLLLRTNVLQSLNRCMFSRQMTVTLLPKIAVTLFKYHNTIQ